MKKPISRCLYCGSALYIRHFFAPCESVIECENNECGAQFFTEFYELVQEVKA